MTMSKEELREECNVAVDKLLKMRVEVRNVTSLKINDKAISRLGLCRRIKGEECFEIEISKFILDDRDLVKEVMYHELLHTVEGCMNHGEEWKELARRVNEMYGMNIKCTTRASEGMRRERKKRAKYEVSCVKCAVDWLYMRRTKAFKNPELFICPECKGKLVSREL